MLLGHTYSNTEIHLQHNLLKGNAPEFTENSVGRAVKGLCSRQHSNKCDPTISKFTHVSNFAHHGIEVPFSVEIK